LGGRRIEEHSEKKITIKGRNKKRNRLVHPYFKKKKKDFTEVWVRGKKDRRCEKKRGG